MTLRSPHPHQRPLEKRRQKARPMELELPPEIEAKFQQAVQEQIRQELQ